MSAYRCAQCERILDSHDGCFECPWSDFECICPECEDELRMEAEDRATETSLISVGGHADGGSAS